MKLRLCRQCGNELLNPPPAGISSMFCSVEGAETSMLPTFRNRTLPPGHWAVIEKGFTGRPYQAEIARRKADARRRHKVAIAKKAAKAEYNIRARKT